MWDYFVYDYVIEIYIRHYVHNIFIYDDYTYRVMKNAWNDDIFQVHKKNWQLLI